MTDAETSAWAATVCEYPSQYVQRCDNGPCFKNEPHTGWFCYTRHSIRKRPPQH